MIVVSTCESDASDESIGNKVFPCFPIMQYIDSGMLNTDVCSLLAACRFVLMFDKLFTVGLHEFISVGLLTDIFFTKCLLAFAFLEHFIASVRHPCDTGKHTESLPHLSLLCAVVQTAMRFVDDCSSMQFVNLSLKLFKLSY